MSELIKGFKTKNGFNKFDYLSLANKPTFDLVASYRSAGTYIWTCPKDGEYIALIVGGGGSGYVGDHNFSWELESNEKMSFLGGKHGDFGLYRGTISRGTYSPIVVGAGGEAVTYVGYYGNATTNSSAGYGFAGGTSSFRGVVANGGSGGYPARISTSETPVPLRMSDKIKGWFGLDIFLDEKGKPVTMLCDGGDVIHPTDFISDQIEQRGDTRMPSINDYNLSPSTFIYYNPASGFNSSTATGVTPTDCGAGGGALRAYSSNYGTTWTLNGAPGADGGVFIYKVR